MSSDETRSQNVVTETDSNSSGDVNAQTPSELQPPGTLPAETAVAETPQPIESSAPETVETPAISEPAPPAEPPSTEVSSAPAAEVTVTPADSVDNSPLAEASVDATD